MKELNEFAKAFFGLGIGSIFVIGVKRVFHLIFNALTHKHQKERAEVENMKTKLTSLEVAMKALAHDKIYKLTDEYIDRGWVTLDELDNLEYLYTAYRELGGNGTGEKRYNRVQALPIRTTQSDFIKSLDEVKGYDYVKGGEFDELARTNQE